MMMMMMMMMMMIIIIIIMIMTTGVCCVVSLAQVLVGELQSGGRGRGRQRGGDAGRPAVPGRDRRAVHGQVPRVRQAARRDARTAARLRRHRRQTGQDARESRALPRSGSQRRRRGEMPAAADFCRRRSGITSAGRCLYARI